MPYAIRPMRESDARAIAEWRYPGVYAFYDADQDRDDLAELLDPAGWGREYFSADDDAGRYEHATNGGMHPFIRMRRPGSLRPL
jgi:hypothetical protein